MIRHYLTFAHEASLLHRKLAGSRLLACWGQEKDRLGLACDPSGEYAGLELSVDLRIGYGLPVREIHPPKRNRIDLFPEIEGELIEEVDIDAKERALRIALGSGRELVAPFYGPGGGNLLLLEHGEILDSYRAVDDEYAELLSGGEVAAAEWDPERLRERPDLPLRKGLSRAHRRLGPRLVREAIACAGLEPDATIGSLAPEELDPLVEHVDRLYRTASETRTFYIYRNSEEAIFSLLRLTTLSADEYEIEEFTDLPKGVRRFRSLWFRTNQFSTLRRKVVAALEKEGEKLRKGLDHALDTDRHLERAEEWEKKGNVLLANLHAVDRGAGKITLEDWEGNALSMKLDPKLTPPENADRFFRKARGARMEAERGIERAEELERGLREIEEKTEKIEGITGVEQLEELTSLAEGVVQEKQGKSPPEGTAERFRRFTVNGGLEVFAGKNAKNNDELTGRFARPNDIWLHARGTSGSHVVLRWNDREENPPARALEEAAMVAAWYSGARGSDLVPVSWTRRKYVRKPKGAPPGAVLMTREEVLLVPPTLPSNDK